ncbi:fibronectin type III-like domain-contianing protein [Streptomyces mirabilis]|uniref:fibronectin type III-like domain-contianing protein n=1 Tax=Streptomyces mirabilis TaxID=68239 RepID=UPI0033B9AD1C
MSTARSATTTVEIELDRRAFAYWDITRDDWTVAAGRYEVQLAENAHVPVASVELDLAGDQHALPLTLDSTVSEWFGHPSVGSALTEAMAAGMPKEQSEAALADNADSMRLVASMPMRQFLGFLPAPPTHEVLEQLMIMSRSDETALVA